MIEQQTDKAAVLADWLEEDDNEIVAESYDDSSFDLGSRQYLVLTDEEADKRAAEDIEQSLWAFNPSFIVNYLPEEVDEDVVKALQEKYEDANPAFRSMLGDRFDELVEDAIAADGRGHFLSPYDGHENEHEYQGETFYIYRTM